jgi:hypothetical protein
LNELLGPSRATRNPEPAEGDGRNAAIDKQKRGWRFPNKGSIAVVDEGGIDVDKWG